MLVMITTTKSSDNSELYARNYSNIELEKFDSDERIIDRNHTEIARKLLRRLYPDIIFNLLASHEKFDGTGYIYMFKKSDRITINNGFNFEN